MWNRYGRCKRLINLKKNVFICIFRTGLLQLASGNRNDAYTSSKWFDSSVTIELDYHRHQELKRAMEVQSRPWVVEIGNNRKRFSHSRTSMRLSREILQPAFIIKNQLFLWGLQVAFQQSGVLPRQRCRATISEGELSRETSESQLSGDETMKRAM